MNANGTSMMLALLGGLLWAMPAMSANEMRFSDIEARLAAVEQKTSAIPGLTSAAFLSDGDAIDAIAPNESIQTESEDEEISSPAPFKGASDASGHGCGCGSTQECSSSCECGPVCDSGCGCGDNSMWSGCYYADVELMFLRAHMSEYSVGKLSEKYELSPRFVVGYETAGGVGARVRYWTYGRTTTILNDEPDIRFEFDVFDIEATSRFRTRRTEMVVGGGFRFANVEVVYDDEPVSNDMPGLTFAVDMRTYICGDCRSEWSAVYGGRLSVLGGDWEGSEDALIEPVRDDNFVTQELYAGVEYVHRFHSCNMFGRLVFEMQNWHSDAMAQSAGADSIGLVGPGIHAGGTF